MAITLGRHRVLFAVGDVPLNFSRYAADKSDKLLGVCAVGSRIPDNSRKYRCVGKDDADGFPAPYAPDQDLLLAPRLREWLPEGHLAYFIGDVVGNQGSGQCEQARGGELVAPD